MQCLDIRVCASCEALRFSVLPPPYTPEIDVQGAASLSRINVGVIFFPKVNKRRKRNCARKERSRVHHVMIVSSYRSAAWIITLSTSFTFCWIYTVKIDSFFSWVWLDVVLMKCADENWFISCANSMKKRISRRWI